MHPQRGALIRLKETSGVIDRIPGLSTEQLCRVRLNTLKPSRPADVERAGEYRAAIDRELINRFNAPDDGWSSGRQGEPRYLMRAGAAIAIVYRLETHGADRGGYRIEIDGRTLDDYPRNVAEAQAIAECSAISSAPQL